MYNINLCASIIAVLVLQLLCPFVHSSINRSDFFPSDLNSGGSALPPQDDGFAQVPLLYPFRFFNRTFTSVFVNTNGLISFQEGVRMHTPTCVAGNIPLIAAFYADSDILLAGNVTYLETNEPAYLYLAQQQIRNGLSIRELTLQSLFIVSYIDVPFFGWDEPDCNGANLFNTFQLIITTDGVRSYAIFNYETIQWTAGTADGGTCEGIGGFPARAGFDLGIGPGATFKNFGSSCSADIINIASYTNVGIPGKFIFQLDDNFQTFPCEAFESSDATPVNPSFVPVFGHIPITFKGPCTANVSSVACTFFHYQNKEAIQYPAVITSDNSISCIVPYLDVLSTYTTRIQIIYLDNSQKNYSGPMYPILPYYFDLNLYKNGVSWIPGKFGNSSIILDLVLIEFKEKRWTEVKVVRSGIPNIGFFFGNLSMSNTNASSIYAFRLTPIPLGTLNPTELTVPGHLPTSFSDFVYMGSIDRGANIQACAEWARTDPGSPTDLLPCPPYLNMAFVDERFGQISPYEISSIYPGADHCFRQRVPSPSLGDRTCCYKNGQICVTPPGAGNDCPVAKNSQLAFPDNYLKCKLPKLICCINTVDDKGVPDATSCALFYRKRPTNSGVNYMLPALASSGGNAHVVTFDGLSYTFNGYGEYVLVQSSNLTAQGRMSPYVFPNATQAPGTVFKAFVFCQEAFGSNNRTCAQVSVNPPNGVFIYIDGQIVTYNADQIPLTFTANGLSLTIESMVRLSLSFSSGLSFVITTADGNRMLNLIAQAVNALYGEINGLLGHFDGIQSNDLRTPPGTTILTNSTTETIHYQFGENWRVNSTTSLFIYPNGFTWANFQNTSFEPIFTPPTGTVPKDIVDMCGGNQKCLDDYGVTGNAELANGTKKWDNEFTLALAILAQPIMTCPVPSPPAHGQVQLSCSNSLVGTTATYICDNHYSLRGTRTRTCKQNGQWSGARPTCECTLENLGVTYLWNLLTCLLHRNCSITWSSLFNYYKCYLFVIFANMFNHN